MENPNLSSKNFHKEKKWYPFVQSFARNCEGRVLDIGCGEKPHRDWFDVEDYIGIDINPDRNADIIADGLRLPFNDNSFDYIFSMQVLEHVPNPFIFFEEMSRVLREHGRALITTNQMFNLHMNPHDYFRFTRFGLAELAQRAGLSHVDILEVGNLPIRLCFKINDLYEYILPDWIGPVMRILTNLFFWPIIPYDTHEDYIIVGGVFEK